MPFLSETFCICKLLIDLRSQISTLYWVSLSQSLCGNLRAIQQVLWDSQAFFPVFIFEIKKKQSQSQQC